PGLLPSAAPRIKTKTFSPNLAGKGSEFRTPSLSYCTQPLHAPSRYNLVHRWLSCPLAKSTILRLGRRLKTTGRSVAPGLKVAPSVKSASNQPVATAPAVISKWRVVAGAVGLAVRLVQNTSILPAPVH